MLRRVDESMPSPDDLMARHTKAELMQKMYDQDRSVPRGSTKREVAEMLAGASSSGHGDVWDCMEADTMRARTRRRTGWDTVTHVGVLQCAECGRVAASETMYGDQPGDVHDYGRSSVSDVLEDYGL